jgi:hypothetical protein
MAKFYQPKETQGVYDAATNTLTVNEGSRVLIGFQCWSVKEYESITVDTSENVVSARYAVNPTTIELEIDTSRRVSFDVTATQEVIMSAVPKNMVKPLHVVVRSMEAMFREKAVGQEKDPAGCWAACLAYYLRAAGLEKRRFIDVVGDFSGLWDSNGFIKVHSLQTQLAQKKARYHAATDRITPNRLPEFLGRWPLLIGFRHPGGFGHMNVLTAYDDGNDLVRAMDPWFPDPPLNSITREQGQVVFDGSEGAFQFTGFITYRPLAYYQKPMGSGTIIVGYPEEYRKRMP